ncbi:homeobox protein TGIF2LX [Cavia porcellus]|uniref:homeobox protein TGIF2LX n=1 Tax=Cavia porcellus TaxID=10141 RepID=UPI00022B5457|nr:homeobox protein TGIF2LX [Cavia porcellus]
MEDAKETPTETQNLSQSTSVTSRNSTCIDELLASPEIKRQRKGYLPIESVKILQDWLYSHQFKAFPSEAEKQMLSEKTNLSFPQITNWFVNAHRGYALPEMLNQDVNDSKDLEDMDAEETQQANTDSSLLDKVGPVHPDKGQCHPLSPLPSGMESHKKLLDPKSSSNQFIPKSPLKEKVEISTSVPMSFPESVWPEERADFSNFYILVDAAVQRAAELELQKKQESNP